MRSLPMALALLAACAPDGRNGDGDDTGVDAAPVVDWDAPPVTETSQVYAHSGGTLYRVDPTTLVASPVGAMSGLEASLLDLAVDKNGKIVGTTRTNLYAIDANTGTPTLIKALTGDAQNMSSLSYVPSMYVAGSTPGDPDVLVSANDAGDVFEINATTGIANKVGSYGTTADGKTIGSSGDLFGVAGFGVYATVNLDGDKTMDYLAKLDPAHNWKATVMPNPTAYAKIFGLGFWGGKIYGFVDDGFDANTGRMIQIDASGDPLVQGTAMELSSGDIRWFGAGVTTVAPIIQ